MIQLALVGCGGIAHQHARHLLQLKDDCRVAAVCDNYSGGVHAREFRETYFNDAAIYADYDEMLASGVVDLDGVVIVTPHTSHYAQAKAALDRGLHVLTEKPMVTRSDHAYDLWRAVERSGKFLAVAFQAPYTPEFGYLASERDAGRLGRVQAINGWVSQGWLKLSTGTWRQDPALSGGGYAYDTGAHMLNAVMWLMNDPVTDVACFADNLGSPVDINAAACLRFANGAFGSIGLSGNTPPFDNAITIMTDTMLIRTDQYGARLDVQHLDGKPAYPHVPPAPPGEGTPHANFVNAILGREPLRAPVRYGVLLSVLMDAMYESAGNGTVVKVRPVPEKPTTDVE